MKLTVSQCHAATIWSPNFLISQLKRCPQLLLIVYIVGDDGIENLLYFFMFQWGGLSCPILAQRATCIAAWEVPPFLHIQQPCASGKGKL